MTKVHCEGYGQDALRNFSAISRNNRHDRSVTESDVMT